MARALSNSNLVMALSDGVALLTTRRGYATVVTTTTRTGTGSRERLAVAEQMVKSVSPANAEEEAACFWLLL
ncbi:hypothetical protein C4D60_Mb09t14920 [Musa balbisiana]|uniref:Uncharacterized protein n=1 Tax=Musa balbisiana TaxID=52838 RepID=A0A4S8IHW1_MUSBA|nr:hypothetical protein C4D60_Mb09t14920 [Musa balbisiana]